MEGIEVWITAMSSSTLRQFRHTATIVALEFVGCLAQIAAEARKANSVRNRQVEAEEKKVRRNEGRISFLMEKTKEEEEKREVIENVIKDIFNMYVNLFLSDLISAGFRDDGADGSVEYLFTGIVI